jgi:hypothetical protein
LAVLGIRRLELVGAKNCDSNSIDHPDRRHPDLCPEKAFPKQILASDEPSGHVRLLPYVRALIETAPAMKRFR